MIFLLLVGALLIGAIIYDQRRMRRWGYITPPRRQDTPPTRPTTRRPPGRMRRLRRWLASRPGAKLTHRGPMLIVAGCAGYTSFVHIRTVTAAHGADHLSALMAPITVDAMMMSAFRYITHARTTTGRAVAWLGFVTGVAATVAANLAAAEPTVPGRAVAVWPAVALTITVAILHLGDRAPRPVRRSAPARAKVTAAAPARTKGTDTVPARPVRRAATASA